MNTPVLSQSRVIFYGSDRENLARKAEKNVHDLDLAYRELPGGTIIEGTSSLARDELEAALLGVLGNGRGQWVLTPDRSIDLVAFDVDSTLVNGEVIDMIAEYMGVGEQVASVTQAAMEGKLDFNASLAERVALLAGCPVEVLDEIHARLPLNVGARELIGLLQSANIATMMVSGGFSAVTNPLAASLNMTACFSNTLEVEQGRLTGRVIGEVINAQAKRTHVLETCARLGIDPQHAAAVGDGANDLLMMEAVHIGVAYNAKPVVQAQASVALNEPSLAIIAAILGV